MKETGKILLAKKEKEVFLLPQMANRHGLIAGATGTGKTITLQVLTESFSSLGVPVFLADVKGDLAGLCISGEGNPHVEKRVKELGLEGFNIAHSRLFFGMFLLSRVILCGQLSRKWDHCC